MARRKALLLLLLLAAAARADGFKAWKDELKRIEKQEQKFWREFQGRYNDALTAFLKPLDEASARPNDAVNYVLDYTGLRNLYADGTLYAEAKGKADIAFAASGDPKALPELFEALMETAKRVDELDALLLAARPQQRGTWFDQRPGVERHAIGGRMDALLRAIAQCPAAAALLAGDGMRTAVKKDGKRSIVRRVAVLDALGLCPGDEPIAALQAFTTAPESSLRIAALEALLKHGPKAHAALEPLLADKSAPVRRALLEGITGGASGDPLWIAPVLAAYREAVGTVRLDGVRALEALTNQKFGDAVAAWDDWFSTYKAEIEGGKFKKDAIEIREAKRGALPVSCNFFGIPTPSLGVIFAFEGSRRIYWPTDLAVLAQHYKETWHKTRRSWEDQFPSQLATLLREFDKASDAFPPDLAFGAIVLYAACDTQLLGAGKLVLADKRETKAVRHDLERQTGDGWCAPYEGLVAAAALAGMGPENDADFPEPRADTIYLWDTGSTEGGRFMTPESAVAAFQRFNRFRRLVVHTVRICDEGEPSDTFMKGLAAATGGTYVWLKKVE